MPSPQANNPYSKKRWLVMIGAVLLLILVIGGIKACSVKKMIDGFKAMGEPTSTVSTIRVGFDDWQSTVSAVGTLRAVRGVDLAAEVAGVVESAPLRSGTEVRQGALLIQMTMRADNARLRALQSDAALARSTAMRASKQLKAQAISQAQAEQEAAKLKSAEAALAEQQALINKKAIRAPFAGRLGISTINPGQYLNPGDKLVTLQQLDPIHIDFTVPQGSLARVENGQPVQISTDAFPGQSFAGQITAINPVVDASTRNVRIQATLKNPQDKLLPGMFGNITVTSGVSQRYLTLPVNAVAFNPYGETVFVVVRRGEENAADPNKPAELMQSEALKKADTAKNPDAVAATTAAATNAKQLVARQVFIKTGLTRGDQVAVLSGIEEGDEVVTSGQLKLKNGTLVVINNEIQPASDPDPRPVDE